MLSPMPSLLPCQQLSPSQDFIPVGKPLDMYLLTLLPRSWLQHKEQETSIRCCQLWFPASTREMLGPPGSHRISVFQGEATRLKQDASALLSLVDTYMAQYRQLQSRTGRWEEEIKQLLRRGEGERAVRGWLGGCGLSRLQRDLEPWWDACGTTATTCCPSLFAKGDVALPVCCKTSSEMQPLGVCHLEPVGDLTVCVWSCWCRVSPALYISSIGDRLKTCSWKDWSQDGSGWLELVEEHGYKPLLTDQAVVPLIQGQQQAFGNRLMGLLPQCSSLQTALGLSDAPV